MADTQTVAAAVRTSPGYSGHKLFIGPGLFSAFGKNNAIIPGVAFPLLRQLPDPCLTDWCKIILLSRQWRFTYLSRIS